MKQKSSVQFKHSSYLLPVLVTVTLFMQLIDPTRVWTLLSTVLGLLWAGCYYWARQLSQKVTLYREMRYGWAQVGDRLEERWSLVNRSWLPALWVEVIDCSTLPGYNNSRATGVDGTSTNSWRTDGLCTQRGIFTLGPTSLRTGDPFGLFQVEIHLQSFATLTVMPPIIPLPAIEVAPGGRAGEGKPRRNAPERTVSTSGVRDYQPGDSLRWIHWRTTARRDSPYVRVFDGTPAGDWWIFLDLFQGAQAGHGWDSTEEHGVILAASLASLGIDQQNSVGLVTNSKVLTWLPPDSGGITRKMEIMRALAVSTPGTSSFEDLLRRTKPSISKYSSLILITPDCSTGWIEALVPLIWRGVVPTVLLLDPLSFGGTTSGKNVGKLLNNMGVAHYLISRDLLDRSEARPGHDGEWEWRVMPTGKAVAVRQPTDQSWKVLS